MYIKIDSNYTFLSNLVKLFSFSLFNMDSLFYLFYVFYVMSVTENYICKFNIYYVCFILNLNEEWFRGHRLSVSVFLTVYDR